MIAFLTFSNSFPLETGRQGRSERGGGGAMEVVTSPPNSGLTKGVTRIPIYSIILAQYTSILKIIRHVCQLEYLISGKCEILYTHISTYFNNNILYTKSKMAWNP
jgi:hypothetical protein